MNDTPTQSVRAIVRSAKELHSGLIPFISPQRGMFPTETGIKPSARIKKGCPKQRHSELDSLSNFQLGNLYTNIM